MTTAGPMCATSLSLRVRDAGGGGVPAGCVERRPGFRTARSADSPPHPVSTCSCPPASPGGWLLRRLPSAAGSAAEVDEYIDPRPHAARLAEHIAERNGSATPLATDVGAGRFSCILDREGQDRCLAPPIGLAPTCEEDNGTMRKNAAHGLVLVGLFAWVGACAEAPTALIDAARARIDAMTAEGQIYAPQEYTAARDAVGRLDAELQAQADRFALTRSYDRATELAGAVATAADDVARAIDAEQARLRTETGRLVTDAVGVLDEARPAIEEFPEEDAADLRRDVENVEASLAAVASALQSDQYTAAHEGAQSAVAAARDIGSSLAALAAASNDVAEDAVTRAVRGAFDLPRRAYVNGQPLEPGPYRVRLTDEAAPPGVDEDPSTTTRWIEFLHEAEGAVAGRGLAIVISDSEIDALAKSSVPRNQVRLDELQSGEYIRLWLNRGGSNYLVHMPTSAP